MALKLELGSMPTLFRVNPRLFRHLCAVAALVFIAYFAAKTVLFLTNGPADTVTLPPGITEQKAAPPASMPRKTLSAYEQIVSVNIFGGDAKGSPREEIDLESIPMALASLRLKLVGTVIDGNGNEGANIAFIEDLQAKAQNMYREGDQVKNVTVRRILRNSVVINTGQRDEVLTMELDPKASRSRPSAPGPTRPAGRTPGAAESRSIDRESVESSLEDLTQLMQDAQIDTYIEDGKPSGFRFSNIKPESFYSRLGLRDKDIILKINGQDFSDPSQFLSLKDDISGAEGVVLTIMRDDSEQVLQFDISE
jgi:general secretion pathway protein C